MALPSRKGDSFGRSPGVPSLGRNRELKATGSDLGRGIRPPARLSVGNTACASGHSWLWAGAQRNGGGGAKQGQETGQRLGQRRAGK